MWLIRMIICRRPIPPDDHLQEAGPSCYSFAKGRSIHNNNDINDKDRDNENDNDKNNVTTTTTKTTTDQG